LSFSPTISSITQWMSGKAVRNAPHLLKTFTPLLLARKRVKFHESNGHEMVQTLKPTLIDYFLNKTGEHCFVLRSCHGILSFSANFWNSVNRVVGQLGWGRSTIPQKPEPLSRWPMVLQIDSGLINSVIHSASAEID
jgi:hypothetical protein